VIRGTTTLIAHLGYPTEAFKAPMIYNPYFEQAGIDAVVVPMGVKAEDYPGVLASQFGVTQTLIGNYVRHEHEPAPWPDVKGSWYSLDHTFVIEPGEAKLPRPPITGKTVGERPMLTILNRS
jgi:hypothetical protein